MNNLLDPRDRTAEFFNTINALKKNAPSSSLSSSSSLSHPIQTLSKAEIGMDLISHSSSSSSFSFSPHNNTINHHNNFNNNPSSFSHHPSSSSFSSSSSSSSSSSNPYLKQSEFTRAAQSISLSIISTTEKLEKLSRMARQRSLFNDSSAEINDLTAIIKKDIQTLHSEIEILAEYVQEQREKAFGGSGVGGGGIGSSIADQKHSTAVVDQLKSKLALTTKNFAEVLQIRTKNLKEQNSRRKQFEGNNNNSVALRKRTANPFGDLLAQTENQETQLLLEPLNNNNNNSNNTIQEQLLAPPPMEQDHYLESRAAAVEQIESTLVELSGMYKQLVSLVHEQGEIAVRIDANLDMTLQNVERGQNELLKYFDRIASSKWLILKVFAVLIIFIIFFMVFIA